MTDDTTDTPARKKPGRKPGPKPGGGTHGTPIRTVAFNPQPSGMVLVEIRMELPLPLAIELVSAAAAVQTQAEDGGPGGKVAGIRAPFPGVGAR